MPSTLVSLKHAVRKHVADKRRICTLLQPPSTRTRSGARNWRESSVIASEGCVAARVLRMDLSLSTFPLRPRRERERETFVRLTCCMRVHMFTCTGTPSVRNRCFRWQSKAICSGEIGPLHTCDCSFCVYLLYF